MLDLTFGEQVKIVLSRKGMTIKELAEIIESKTGKKMSRQNLTQRLGRDNFQEQDMRMIAEILECPFQLNILNEDDSIESNYNNKEEAMVLKKRQKVADKKAVKMSKEAALEEDKESKEPVAEESPVAEQSEAIRKEATPVAEEPIQEAEESSDESEMSELEEVSAETDWEDEADYAEGENLAYEQEATYGQDLDEETYEESPEEYANTYSDILSAVDYEDASDAYEETSEEYEDASVAYEDASEEYTGTSGEYEEFQANDFSNLSDENEQAYVEDIKSEETLANEQEPVNEPAKVEVKEEAKEEKKQKRGWFANFRRGRNKEEKVTKEEVKSEPEVMPVAEPVVESVADFENEMLQETQAAEQFQDNGAYINSLVQEANSQNDWYPQVEEAYREEVKAAESVPVDEEDLEHGDINPYTGREYQTNSVRVHPKKIGYVQVYNRSIHAWEEMTEWAFLGYQEQKKAELGKNYEEPIYLD